MAKSDYGKYIIRKPIYEETGPRIKNCQSPPMTFISNKLIPGADNYVQLGWIYGVPEPNTYINEHAHNFDQIIIYWGGNAKTPQDLGAEIEFVVGGEPLIIDKTSALFIPKGVKHGPLTWKKFTRPHMQMAIMIGTGSYKEGWPAGVGEPK